MAIIVDTGPIVALLDRRDGFHEWASDQFDAIEAPAFTCEPVLAEAAFLVRRLPRGALRVLDLVERGVLAVPYQLESDVSALRERMDKYADVPMALADACLVRMAETIANSRVLTLDGDFRVYRMHGRRRIPVLMPT